MPPLISSSLFIPPLPPHHPFFSPPPFFPLLSFLPHTWGQTSHQSNLTPPAMTNGHLKRATCQGRQHGGRRCRDGWRKNILKVKETNDQGESNRRGQRWSGRRWRLLGGNRLKVPDSFSLCGTSLYFESVYFNLCMLLTSYQRVCMHPLYIWEVSSWACRSSVNFAGVSLEIIISKCSSKPINKQMNNSVS